MTRHRVFISWSTVDARVSDIAARYKDWLQQLFGPRLEIFLSSENIDAAEPWASVVRRQLKTSTVGIVLLTPRTARSPWVAFESGALEVAFPILLDLTPAELERACPPLATLQTVAYDNRPRALGMVEQIIELAGAQDARVAIEAAFEAGYDQFVADVRRALSDRPMLPEHFTGTLAYNRRINDSAHFQMPQLFDVYRRQLFLVGINLTWLLNLKLNEAVFVRLLKSLVGSAPRRCMVLIADLWDEKLRYAYNRVVSGHGETEFADMQKVFDRNSPYYIDTVIRRNVTPDEYARLATRLTIKKIALLMDTFWFVDADTEHRDGNLLIATMTTSLERGRPVFYVDQARDYDLFEYYRAVCDAGFNLANDVLWPPPPGV